LTARKLTSVQNLPLNRKTGNKAKQKAYGENSLYINEALSKIKTTLIQIKQNFELKGQIYTLQDIKNEFLGKNTKIEVKSYKTTILQDLEKVQTIRAKNNSETTNHRDKSYFRKIKQFLEKSNLHDKPSEQITKVDIEVV
jgi:MFS superfamily sulfate permease-like transporter